MALTSFTDICVHSGITRTREVSTMSIVKSKRMKRRKPVHSLRTDPDYSVNNIDNDVANFMASFSQALKEDDPSQFIINQGYYSSKRPANDQFDEDSPNEQHDLRIDQKKSVIKRRLDLGALQSSSRSKSMNRASSASIRTNAAPKPRKESELKTKYREKRNKNNEAVKRSRDKRKRRQKKASAEISLMKRHIRVYEKATKKLEAEYDLLKMMLKSDPGHDIPNLTKLLPHDFSVDLEEKMSQSQEKMVHKKESVADYTDDD